MKREPALAAAAEAIRAGSKSFAAAARLFDRSTREGAILLYAWCRYCDDVVDGQALGFRSERGETVGAAERLALLQARTAAALRGEPDEEPAYVAIAEAVRRHAIPERYPAQHLAGFRMDVQGRTYRTIADTLDYAYHVAGVVGVMMAHVMGVRDPALLDRASDLGLAFQLTNIARDVVDDAEAGRVYLPAEWLIEAGLPHRDGVVAPAAVRDPAHRARVAVVAARLVTAAEPYYASAAIGIRDLPPRSAWAIATARGLYRAIGLEVIRRGEHAWDRRVSTSRAAKLRHVATGAVAALGVRVTRLADAGARPPLYARPR